MSKVDLSVDLAGVKMKNPIVVASGTFGFGREYGQFYNLNELGGICCKGLTLHRREGNPPPRIAETPMGILNSVGLQNPGVDAFIEQELPELKKHDLAIISNISGNTPEEYGVMCEKLSAAGVAAHRQRSPISPRTSTCGFRSRRSVSSSTPITVSLTSHTTYALRLWGYPSLCRFFTMPYVDFSILYRDTIAAASAFWV